MIPSGPAARTLKRVARPFLRPLRGSITWALQEGVLPLSVRQYLPWRWALEPFTIYGAGWKCRWFPTEFDAVGHQIFWSGLRRWEKETAPVILDQIRRSRCFIDIGANCGVYTVMGCVASPQTMAVAIEPVPGIFAALVSNVKRNHLLPRVTLLNLAIGESNGTVPFHEAEDATMGSFALDGYQGQNGRIIEVNCRTLDSIVAEARLAPDFLKIDVEGFTDAVLAGAGGTLASLRPRIVLEANPGDSCERINAILSEHGYTCQSITARGLEAHGTIVPQEKWPNWLCTPRI